MESIMDPPNQDLVFRVLVVCDVGAKLCPTHPGGAVSSNTSSAGVSAGVKGRGTARVSACVPACLSGVPAGGPAIDKQLRAWVRVRWCGDVHWSSPAP